MKENLQREFANVGGGAVVGPYAHGMKDLDDVWGISYRGILSMVHDVHKVTLKLAIDLMTQKGQAFLPKADLEDLEDMLKQLNGLKVITFTEVQMTWVLT